MDGINLVPAVAFLGKDGFEYLKQPVVVMIIPKITAQSEKSVANLYAVSAKA